VYLRLLLNIVINWIELLPPHEIFLLDGHIPTFIGLLLLFFNLAHYNFAAIKISKDSIIISQRITKAFLAIHSRQMEPTIAGLPLHRHTVATAVTRFESDIQIKAQPSLWNIMSAKNLKTSFDVKPK